MLPHRRARRWTQAGTPATAARRRARCSAPRLTAGLSFGHAAGAGPGDPPDGTITFAYVQAIDAQVGHVCGTQGQPIQQTFWYDEENRLVRQEDPVTGLGTNYTYDGQGALVKKVRETGSDPVTTIYVGGLYELRDDQTTIEVTKYYSFNGSRVAMRTDDVRSFLLGDHLGSTSTVLDSAGDEVATQKYYPYGRARNETGTMPSDKLFTGHQQEGDLLLHAGPLLRPKVGALPVRGHGRA